jgi:hypothetical protein
MAIGIASLLICLILSVFIAKIGNLGKFAGGFIVGFVGFPIGLVIGILLGILSFFTIRFERGAAQ